MILKYDRIHVYRSNLYLRVMTNKSTLIALVAALAVTSGGLGLSLTNGFNGDATTQSSNTASGLMMGHITVEAYNEAGDMIAYRQTDNEVVNTGEQCILKMLFKDGSSRGGTGTTVCTGALTTGWTVIGIGTDNDNGIYATGASNANKEIQVRLGNETSTTTGLIRADATSTTWTNGTNTATTKIELAKTFTMTSGNTHNIGESGLFNSTTVAASGMLARQTFSDVALTNGDSITVTWTFTVGN